MKTIIRKTTTKDLSQIQKLMDVLNNSREKNFSKQNKPFHKRLKQYPKLKKSDIENDIFLVAVDDNKIVGFIWGSIHRRRSHKLSKLGYIEEICVDKKIRSKGLGKKLLKFLEEEFTKLGCDHVTTHTDWENKPAQKLYSKSGMNKVTVEYWKRIYKK